MMFSSDGAALRRKPSIDSLQYYSLFAAGVLEFIFIVLGSMFHSVAFYWTGSFIVLPGVLFAGITLTSGIPDASRKSVLLCLLTLVWFFVSQTQHRLQQMEPNHIDVVFCVYLLAFPYAAVTQDGVRQRGLKSIAAMYILATLVLAGYSVLLLLDLLPTGMREDIIWDGVRLLPLWHPNITACLFMIGIAFCSGLFFQSKNKLVKYLAIPAILLQFVFLSLTNCRTSILMTCGLLGAVFFFSRFQRGWKQCVLLLMVSALLIAVLFSVSGMLFQANQERLIQQYLTQEANAHSSADSQEASASDASSEADASSVVINEQTGQISLPTDSPQGSWENDLRTLNGRTIIWRSALRALLDTPSILLWGTEYSGTIISIYNPFEVYHGHNSWVEVLFLEGILGLCFALVFTWITLRSGLYLVFNPRCDMWKKCVSMAMLCMLVSGFLEPFLFSVNTSHQMLNFIFFVCIGYMNVWFHECKNAKTTE